MLLKPFNSIVNTRFFPPPQHTLPSGFHLNCLCMARQVFASNSNESLHTRLPFSQLGL